MTNFEPYCNEGCGRPATCEVPLGVASGGELITEWVCDRHAMGTYRWRLDR